MKNNNCLIFFILILCFSIPFSSPAQVNAEQILQSIGNNKSPRSAAIKQFYEKTFYRAAWMNEEGEFSRTVFLEAVKHSHQLGLKEKDYSGAWPTALPNGLKLLSTIEDSLAVEMAITDAAIHFYSDLAYGNVQPSLGYNGLGYMPQCMDIPSLLAENILQKTLPSLPGKLSSTSPVVIALENSVKSVTERLSDVSYKEVMLTSNRVNRNNQILITKLYRLGIIDDTGDQNTDSLLKQKVKEAQRRFNLPADGYLNSLTIRAMNIPLQVRLQELALALNYYRWLNCLTRTQQVIVVNIPAAYLKVYMNGSVNLEMRVIVGKTSTPTATLASKVNEVILYPYWHVPYSIATRELLPSIKRNPGYIDAGNYQVLDKAGNIVNPYSVNWHALSRTYFPYLIRQSTGCDNALGLLKLNFYNPFGMYLHDTPGKDLFKQHRRYFSHGCMRMEKPMELGHLVLKNNHIAIDTLEQKGCLQNQSPVTVHANDHMPVIVWYNPVDIDSTGRVVFFEDVYKKFAWRNKQ